MTVVEETGFSPDEAVEVALSKLRLSRELVLIEVLDEGARGLFGLVGHRLARIRVTVSQTGERVETARDLVEGILGAMHVTVEVSGREGRDGGVEIEITGDDAGLLIGKRGQTLEALQYLVGRMVGRRPDQKFPLWIDVAGYQSRRRQQLETLAVRVAERVKMIGEPVSLEPMNPADRRAVHLALQHDSEIETASVGEGQLRKIVISPTRRK